METPDRGTVSNIAFAAVIVAAAALVILVFRSSSKDTAGVAPDTLRAGTSPSTSAAPRGSATTTATPTPTSSTEFGDAAPLAQRLLNPPPPWTRVSDAEARTGPLTIDAAARIDGGGALSRTGLQQMGYRTGINRAWSSDDAGLLVLAYQFATERGAQQYVQYAKTARSQDATYVAQPPTSGVPASYSFRRSADGSLSQVVLFAKDNVAYIVGTVSQQDRPAPGVVDELVRLQYDAAG